MVDTQDPTQAETAQTETTISVARARGIWTKRGLIPVARVAVRFMLAIAVSAFICLAAWSLVGSMLSVSTQIVGYPAFNDWDPYRYVDAFRIIVYLFPVVAVGAYLLLSWRGPLQKEPRAPRPWPPLIADEVEEGSDPPPRAVSVFWRVGRLLLPGIALALEIAIARSYLTFSWTSLAPAIVYLALLLVIGGAASFRSGELDYNRFRSTLTAANTFGALLVIPGAYLVSRSTSVFVVSGQQTVYYYWFPLWLCVILTIAAAAACLVVMLRSRFVVATLRKLEVAVLYVIVGPMLIFLGSAFLPGAQGEFQSFDDAMGMTGAQLTFYHGLLPWRDIQLLHGPLFDVFYGALGFVVFSHSRWGSNAGQDYLIAPMIFILIMGFTLYFARRNRLVAFGVGLAIVLSLISSSAQSGFAGQATGVLTTRFALLFPLLIVFDQMLRRRSRVVCAGFMLLAVVAVIMTPEIFPLFVGILLTLVVFEVVHRSRGTKITDSFFRTISSLISGLLLVGIWAVFLASEGALGGFVDYIRIYGASLVLWEKPLAYFTVGFNLTTFEMVLPVVLYLLTVWRVVWKIRSRSAWSTRDWVLVATAAFVPLYYEHEVTRLDPGHVEIVWEAIVPLLVLWVIIALSFLDQKAVGFIAGPWRGRSLHLRHPVTAAAVLVVALASPTTITSFASAIPANFHPEVPTPPPADVPSLGYTIPGTVDTAQIADLGKVLDTYAPNGEPVFDFANEPGITYFLLNRVPGVSIDYEGGVYTGLAQQLEIAQLEKSRPPVVIFYDQTFGVPLIDGISAEERSYQVADYLLSQYRPLLDIDGQLILIRNDLYGHVPPPPRDLSSVPQTSDLYAAEGSCDWGDVPNFLTTPSSVLGARKTQLRVHEVGGKTEVAVQGWAMDGRTSEPALGVIAVADDRVVARSLLNVSRPDVARALSNQAMLQSGYNFSFEVPGTEPYRLYAVNGDSTVTPIPGVPTSAHVWSSVSLDGLQYPVRAGYLSGHEQSQRLRQISSSWEVELPAGQSLGQFSWLELDSSSELGNGSYGLSDPSVSGSAPILFGKLPRSGHRVFVEVGSCLNWHGYSSNKLLLSSSGSSSSVRVYLEH